MTVPLSPAEPAALPEAWMREVRLSLSLAPHLLLTGNVRDLHQLPPAAGGGRPRLLALQDVLWEVCREQGYAALLSLDPLRGVDHVHAPQEPHDPLSPRPTGDCAISSGSTPGRTPSSTPRSCAACCWTCTACSAAATVSPSPSP